jgi:hypothetical protein
MSRTRHPRRRRTLAQGASPATTAAAAPPGALRMTGGDFALELAFAEGDHPTAAELLVQVTRDGRARGFEFRAAPGASTEDAAIAAFNVGARSFRRRVKSDSKPDSK